jgi:hypothetical protein
VGNIGFEGILIIQYLFAVSTSERGGIPKVIALKEAGLQALKLSLGVAHGRNAACTVAGEATQWCSSARVLSLSDELR